MSIQCELKELSPQSVMSVRRRTPVQSLPKVIGDAYQAIAHYLGEIGEPPVGPPFAAYYNLDMQDLDVELGFPVMKTLPGKGDIKPSEIPGGKAATSIHVGPYSDVEPSYNALFKWIKDNGYEWMGVAYEFYMNDPEVTPPEELLTQIILPLKNN